MRRCSGTGPNRGLPVAIVVMDRVERGPLAMLMFQILIGKESPLDTT